MGKPSGGSFVGLDVGTQTIKVVEVRGVANNLQVTALGMENTPPGSIQQGVVTDAKALGVAIKSLLQKAGVRSKKVVAAAAGAQSVVVRVIEVPKMSPAELAETMKWEVERHIPFAANDVEMGYQALEEPAGADPNNPNMEVLLAVAQREMVGSLLSTLQSAGLTPVAIDVEPLATGRSMIDLDKSGLVRKNAVVVNIGASNTDVGIFKSGVLRFPRTLPLAGDNFTRAISDHLGLSMDQAEDEKRENGSVIMELVNTPPPDDPFGGGFGGEGGGNAGGGFGGGSPFDFSDVPMATPFATPFTPGESPTAPGGVPSPFDDQPTVVPGSPFATPPASAAGDQPTIVPGSPFASPAGGTPPANPFADNPFAENPFATASGESPTQGTLPGGGAPGSAPALVPDDPRAQRKREVFEALLPVLQEFAMELRRSVDYFRSRYPSETIDQIVLCGGSARLPNLDQFIQADLGIPTVVADPFAGLNVTARQVSAEYRGQVAPAFGVALGLAARDAIIGPDK